MHVLQGEGEEIGRGGAGRPGLLVGGGASREKGQVEGRGSSYGTYKLYYSVVLFNISLLRYNFEFIKKKRDFIKKVNIYKSKTFIGEKTKYFL